MTAASDEVTAANAKTIAAVAHLIWTSGDIAGKRARVTFIEKPFFVHSSEGDFHRDDVGSVRARGSILSASPRLE